MSKLDSLLRHGLILAILSSIFSSLAAIFQTQATKVLSPWCVAAFGNLLGGTLVAIFILIARRGIPAHRLRDVLHPLVFFVLLRGIFGGVTFNLGLSLTTAIKAVFLTKAEPYFVLFWGWVLDGTRVPRRHMALLVLHLTGAAILSGAFTGVSTAQLGDLLLLVSVCTSALSYRFGVILSHQLGSLRTNSILQLCSGLILLPLPIFLTPQQSFSFEHPWAWGYLVAYVFLFSILGLSLWLVSIRTLDLWIVSALRAIGPLVAAPVAWWLFGDSLSMIQILGGLIVISTSALIAAERRQ